ncbi:EspG family protein [Amycolatopsis arida]|uniref:EspG family protein n=1 Tax=Amycolatopsis arida TaxID=587909 RepID=A0A1I5TNT2_9PSEU|nr:ESX secretion-associated protein EspG [Amycolatopsis arida]TDX96030.1 ESAT-6 protein secretion system EspG family protein [Amycolatopsis arida]SFP84638.1 EspG family protein [Amycolatopsis arida]
MLDKQVTLTTGTLLNLIRRHGAEPHTVLASTPTWLSDEARRAQDERANAELAGYGLLGPRGVDPGLRATLDAVARPEVEFYAWIQGGYEGQPLNYTVLAGSAGGEGFVLARNTDHEGIVLVSVRPNELLENFVAQLPGLAPGKGQPLSVPKSEATGSRAARHPDDDGYAVLRSGTPSAGGRAVEELRRILGLRRLGGGALYAAARTRGGSRQRVDRPVNYIDTVEGRWLTEERPGSGEPMIVFTPATPQLLADRLRGARGRLGG